MRHQKVKSFLTPMTKPKFAVDEKPEETRVKNMRALLES
jgi:hypothetical protein